ncbi:MAG: methylated-DNA--[protein]-cysteine S-methyltransferase [Alcaligenaceae bacterium]|nr:methylated-DNA--[protein]-cysteine S-methyltransferase [Alcaligenaceae bacterium]
MPCYAVLSSPLGDILLLADAHSLTGLYFTDQRDCPHLPGLAVVSAVVSQPSAGTVRGRTARTLKAVRAGATATTDDLFAADTPTSPAARPPQLTGLRLVQPDTPADTLAVFQQARQELDEYWRGERQVFDVPPAPQGTLFQKRIWQALLEVSYGATLSYGELGEHAGLGAGHGRAVGTAVGSNPISIIIPCHRILARNGTLNGYGGGLERKAALLELEGFVVG